MTKRTRPYKLRATYANRATGNAVTDTLATYASLASAVRAAERLHSTRPDIYTDIVLDGQILRCRYHHGTPDQWQA